MAQIAQLLDEQLGDNIDFVDINCGKQCRYRTGIACDTVVVGWVFLFWVGVGWGGGGWGGPGGGLGGGGGWDWLRFWAHATSVVQQYHMCGHVRQQRIQQVDEQWGDNINFIDINCGKQGQPLVLVGGEGGMGLGQL